MGVASWRHRKSTLIRINLFVLDTLAWILHILSFIILCGGLSSSEPLLIAHFIIVVIMNMLSMFYVHIQMHVMKKDTIRSKKPSTSFFRPLEYLCSKLPGVLLVGWIFPATLGLFLLARQPSCVPSDFSTTSIWQRSAPCHLYRSIIVLNMLMLLVACSLFYLLELRVSTTASGKIRKHDISKPFDSRSPNESRTFSPFSDEESGYIASRQHASCIEHQQWLQRRNSLSSQRAIYPYKHRAYPHQRSGRSRSTLSNLHSVSEISEPCALYTESRYPSSMIGGSSTTGSTLRSGWPRSSPSSGGSYTNMPLSMSPSRGVGVSPVRALRNDKSDTTIKIVTERRAPSPPPPSWCPSSLRQSPLSTDPMIKALSSTTDLDQVSHMTTSAHSCEDATAISLVQTDLKRSVTTPSLVSQAVTSPNSKRSLSTTAISAATTSSLERSVEPNLKLEESAVSESSIASINQTCQLKVVEKEPERVCRSGQRIYQKHLQAQKSQYSLMPPVTGPVNVCRNP